MSITQIIDEIFIEGKVQHPDGNFLKVGANISVKNSYALRQLIQQRQPKLVVEIGMAYGVSTLSILSELDKNDNGRLISIDPYIGWPTGRLVALHRIQRAGVAHRHSHMHMCSYEALPKLLTDNMRPDLIYIDGNHNFDYVFTDFFFSDKLLGVGGIIAFNDAGWRSVYKVIRFLKKYRKYSELDVGLSKRYTASNPFFSLIKRIEGRSTYDRYFEKIKDWEPDHEYHWFF